MLCPYCTAAETKVTDKRDSGSVARRRRECLKCGKRFTTYERVELDLSVIKKDGRRQKFSRKKLSEGIANNLEKRPFTSEQVEEIVSWVRYPPSGIRGFACNTAQSGGEAISAEEHVESANRETLLVIQIERREAVANLEEMLSIEGVDVACLGFMDLSVDLGVPGQLEHPTAVGAVTRLIDVADGPDMGLTGGAAGAAVVAR